MKEIWKDIPGYEGRYMVSNLGNIKSLRYLGHPGEKIIKQYADRLGYMTVYLYRNGKQGRKCYLVHRLVAKAFISNPENKKEINHIDGDKGNNKVNNLEWCTRSENILHASKILKKAMGGESTKVTCIETGVEYKSMRNASIETGIPYSQIWGVVNNKRLSAHGFHWRKVV